jgi:microcystin-dependent protein
MTGQFLGQILQVAFNYAPRTWSTCSAQQMAINSNQALFAILGTVYGGNGQTTFALPDLRGRVANHWGQGPGLQDYMLGEQSGTPTTTMLPVNLPLHNHPLVVSNQSAGAPSPSGNAMAVTDSVSGSVGFFYGPNAGTTMGSATIAPNGNSAAIGILQPYTTLQYCIALQGIFPSRN